MVLSNAPGLSPSTIDLTGSGKIEHPRACTILTGTRVHVERMTFLPEAKLLIATCSLPHIHVYDMDTTGAPRTVFNQHTETVGNVAQLEGDIVASVDDKGTLFSWRAATGQLVDQWKHNTGLWNLMTIEKDKLVLGDVYGTISVLEHKSGSNFQEVLRFKAHHTAVNDLALFRNRFVLSLSVDGPVRLWENTTFAHLATLRSGETSVSAAVNDQYILLTSKGGNVYVYHNSDGYPLDFMIRLTENCLYAIAFINEDVIAVSDNDNNLYFVSLFLKSVLSKIKVDQAVLDIAVLSDGRLALGCRAGYSAFIELPESVRQIEPETIDLTTSGRIEQMGSSTALTGTKICVRRFIFVPERQLVVVICGSLRIHVYDMDKTGTPRIVFTNHTAYPEDVALLTEDIVASVDSDGMLISWRAATGELVDNWKHSKGLELVMEVGKDRLVLLEDYDYNRKIIVLEQKSGSNFREVLSVNQAQFTLWYDSVLFRRCFGLSLPGSKNGTVKIWNATSFAPLATLQPGESVHSAAVSDRHILLLSACGTIYVYRHSDGYPLDFVFHLSKKMLGAIAFVNEDVFAVSDSDGILYFVSLSVKSVLSKIEVEIEVVHIVVLSDGRLALSCSWGSCILIEPPESVCEIIANGAATFYSDCRHTIAGKRPSPHAETTGQGGQLDMWKEIGVCNNSVRDLKSDEVAACLAACIVNYEQQFTEKYKKCKNVLVEHFRKSFVFGESFTDGDEEDRKALSDAVMKGLAKVTDEDSMIIEMMKMRVKRFVRQAAE